MSCVLRAAGADFEVDDFLAKSALSPCQVWHRGEPRTSDDHILRDTSGFNVDVSTADWDDVDGQIKDAIKFLRKHATEITRLASARGVEKIICDFGTRRRPELPMQGVYFPADLVRLAGELGVGLKASSYAMAEPKRTRIGART